MSTLEKIVAELKTGRDGGAAYVLENWLAEHNALILELAKVPSGETPRWLSALHKRDEVYERIYGYIWGLTAAGFISNCVKDAAVAELIAREE